jgi:hypothetical protein
LGYGTKYKDISIDGGMKKKRAFKHPHRIIYVFKGYGVRETKNQVYKKIFCGMNKMI